MIERRGSSYWPGELAKHIDQFTVDDIVSSVIVGGDGGTFIGVVRDVNHKTNKVLVGWGGGSVVQHDPDEIQLLPWIADQATRNRYASRRDLISLTEEEAEKDPDFTGNPKIHGLDEPRGGGFSIMQNLQKDLHKESQPKEKSKSMTPECEEGLKAYTIEKPLGLKPGDEILQDDIRHPSTGRQGYVIETRVGQIMFLDEDGGRDSLNTKWENHFRRKYSSVSNLDIDDIPESRGRIEAKTAMYWAGKERVYRRSRAEQTSGITACPKCKAEMDTQAFTKREKLHTCECGFKVSSKNVINDRVIIDDPEPVQVLASRRGQ